MGLTAIEEKKFHEYTRLGAAPPMRIDDPERDPRHAASYDTNHLWSEADDFFLGVANRKPGLRVLDLGCGTGRLALALALAGHAVMGVDPNPAFLSMARTKPGSDQVAWIRGEIVVIARR